MGNLSITSNILKSMETSSSIGMFARDTLGCLGSKLAVSRSTDEAKEITFAELTESALFYFSAPLAAKFTSGKFAKIFNISKNDIKIPINEIKNVSEKKLKNIKLAKFGQIISTFGIILPLIYLIAPVRNILTYNNSGKDEFASVVGLKKEADKKPQNNKKKDIKSLLLKALAVSSAVQAAAGAVIFSASKKNSIYKKLEPVINLIIKHLDFTKEGDLTLKHYGALIYPVSIASYFKSSRDKYEREENARRFSITVPLMFFGEKIIEKPIYNTVDKIFNTKISENGRIKTYKDIMNLPKELQNKYLKSKNSACGLTFLINTVLIASAIGILNRIATKKKYISDNNENKR